MTFIVVAVKDELTGRFLEPQFFRSQDEAKRNFQFNINNIKLWEDNPADYSLYQLAEFDEELGFIDAPVMMEKICGGRSMLKGD